MTETNKTPDTTTERHTIKTKRGHAVVLRDFITGAHERYIQNAFMENVDIHTTNGKSDFNIPSTRANEAENRTIESVVMSVDGATEDIVKLILDLPSDDKREVMNEIEEITGEKKSEEKQRSEEHTSELQSHSFISYAVFCLKKKKRQ